MRSGRFAFILSLTIHGVLLAAATFCIRATTSSPPRMHLVYGEHGGEDSKPAIFVPGSNDPPSLELEPSSPPDISTDSLDVEIMGTSFATAGNTSPSAAPLLLSADGSNSPLIGVPSNAVPTVKKSAPILPSTNPPLSPSGRSGASTGTDLSTIPQPVYPKESRRRGEQGTVVLEVKIHPDGRLGDITIVHDAGFPRLAEAAIDALKKARIEPAIEDGQPIASMVRIPFNFVLKK